MDFIITPIVLSDFENVLEFLREYFFPNEPVAKALDLCPHGYTMPAVEASLKEILEAGYSLKATGTGANKAILGVILSESVKNCEEIQNPENCEDYKCRGFPEKFKKITTLFEDLKTDFGNSSIFDKTGFQELFDIFILCTSNKVQKRGLGTKLVEESLKVARSHGFKASQCLALSTYTHKICIKLGFSELNNITYETYSQDGHYIFKGKDMGDHKQSSVLFKRLN